MAINLPDENEEEPIFYDEDIMIEVEGGGVAPV